MGSDPHVPGSDDLDRALERVYRRGAQLRFRRKMNRLISSGVALLVIVSTLTIGVVQIGSNRPDPGLVVIAPAPTDPVDDPSVGPQEQSPAPSESEDPSPPSPDGDSSPTEPECHNSFDPKCGPFYWIRPPGPNAPVVVSIDIAPENPVVGEEVTVTVTVSDEDAPFVGIFADHWGEEGEGEVGTALSCPGTRYGPWTPPDPKPGRKVFTLRHVYAQPGEYDVWFSGYSWTGLPWGGVDCYLLSPYAGEGGKADGVIHVSGGPSPDPSPSSTESPSPSPASS